MIEATARNLVRWLATRKGFRNVTYLPVEPTGRNRFTRAVYLNGEVLIEGRWIAFRDRSAKAMYHLDSLYGRGPVEATGIVTELFPS